MGGALARVGERTLDTGFWWVNPRDRDHFEDLGVDGRVILTLVNIDWVDLAVDNAVTHLTVS
jgi:hypothetical protein